MIVVVSTVPHTGTHFVWQHLLADWSETMVWPDDALVELPGQWYVLRHIEDRFVEQITTLSAYCPLIVPLRHPISVAESWAWRHRVFGKRKTAFEELEKYWRRLIEHIDPLNPYYLPIDTPERYRFLRALNHNLDLQLSTDWRVVDGSGPKRPSNTPRLSDEDTKRVWALMFEHRDFFARFGYK